MQKAIYVLLSGGLAAALVIGYLVLHSAPGAEATARADDAKPAARQADEAAVKKLGDEFASVFEKRDAAAIAAHYTNEGEFIRNDGEAIRGKGEIEKAYAAYFKTLTGKKKLEVQLDNLHFPSTDTAIAEVTLRLKGDDNEVEASSWRETLLVREGGQWKVAVTREWDRDTNEDHTLKDLEWLVGTWEASGKERQATTSFEWDENKAFIRGKYSVKEGGKVVEAGTQLIGKDNNDGVIRSWAFQSDGGFGGGVWTREGKKWTVDVHGVMADGRELTATNVYIKLDPNTFSWQSVNRRLDGEPIPDTAPIKVTKQRAAK